MSRNLLSIPLLLTLAYVALFSNFIFLELILFLLLSPLYSLLTGWGEKQGLQHTNGRPCLPSPHLQPPLKPAQTHLRRNGAPEGAPRPQPPSKVCRGGSAERGNREGCFTRCGTFGPGGAHKRRCGHQKAHLPLETPPVEKAPPPPGPREHQRLAAQKTAPRGRRREIRAHSKAQTSLGG